MPDVSLPATLVAAFAGVALAALWYRPRTLAQYGTTFALGLVASYVFGVYVGPNPGRAFSIVAGAAAGLCWVATSLATNYVIEGRPPALIVIDGGYHAVRFTLIGLTFGLLG